MFEEFRPDAPPRERLRAASGLCIRPATDADLDALAALRAARNGAPLPACREVMERALATAAAGDGALLAAEYRDAVVGYASTARLEPPANGSAPAGWYLTGVVVAPAYRRRGVGTALTRARLRWLAQRTDRVYYFARATNAVSLALHEPFGFAERTRDFVIPGVRFGDGEGILFEASVG